tara:strand:- start:593 stop:1216 length:624 start_codon:yes stop_codon:yes gene_type:complete
MISDIPPYQGARGAVPAQITRSNFYRNNVSPEINSKKNDIYLYIVTTLIIILLITYGALIGVLWNRKNNNGFLIIDGMKKNYITKEDVLNYDNIYLVNFEEHDVLSIADNIGEKAYAKIFCNSNYKITVSFTGLFNIIQHGDDFTSSATYDAGPPSKNTVSYRSKDTEPDKVKIDLSNFELSLYYDNNGTLTVYGLAYSLEIKSIIV